MNTMEMENRELKKIVDEQCSNIEMLVHEKEKLEREKEIMGMMLDNIHELARKFPASPIEALEALEAAKFYSDRKVMEYWEKYQ